MKFNLINPINPKYNAIQQVLTNRGIPLQDIDHYLNTTDKDVASFEQLNPGLMKKAAAQLIKTIKAEEDATIIVDSDCDGFTSAALLFNYLYDAFPYWVENHLTYMMHNGKQHGLNDQIDWLLQNTWDISTVLIPDAGSNDVSECAKLFKAGIATIVLDHHICDVKNEYAIVINNQNCDYPNKALSGVGVTWQFCRFLDSLLQTDYANNYLDLVALGNIADMMSLHSFETKHLIQKGLKEENLKNPFIVYMIEKNRYSLGEVITPIGVAFYIAPFVNAIVRSGTMDEKILVFRSMLKLKAFEEIPSTKRGHAAGAKEKLVEQAVRVATNVKARQTKAQEAGLEKLKSKIETDHILDNKAMIFLLEPGEIDRNIAGLIANKMMAEYQRPCCILTRVEESLDESIPPWEEIPPNAKRISYQGSARGCDKVGITEFKSMCAATGEIMYATGHEGAFGLGIEEDKIDSFIEKINEALKDMPTVPVYRVDYIWEAKDVQPQTILDIAGLEALWGKDLDETLIALKNIRVTPGMVTVYDKNTLTLKIELSNGISIMKFRASELDKLKFLDNNTGYIDVNIVAKCNKNEWMGNITPQLFIEDYEIIDSNKYFF